MPNQQEINAALWPCPFCGEKAYLHGTHLYNRMVFAKCSGCDAQSARVFDELQGDLIKLWNRRSALTTDMIPVLGEVG
jgi:Lar family restriction alleviation protein